jgi:hypothetical protein
LLGFCIDQFEIGFISQKLFSGISKLTYPETVLISIVTELISVFFTNLRRFSFLCLFLIAVEVKYSDFTDSGVSI